LSIQIQDHLVLMLNISKIPILMKQEEISILRHSTKRLIIWKINYQSMINKDKEDIQKVIKDLQLIKIIFKILLKLKHIDQDNFLQRQ
jgi:hypothetical protein